MEATTNKYNKQINIKKNNINFYVKLSNPFLKVITIFLMRY